MKSRRGIEMRPFQSPDSRSALPRLRHSCAPEVQRSCASAIDGVQVSFQGRIADHDTIEITNLNRMRALLPDVGFRKVAVAAQEIWELDPFAEVDAWTSVDFGESDAFAHGSTVVIDEIDNIGMKVALRHSAKAAHVPVVMGTDNGEGVILDVERFDLEPDHPIFHGRVSLDSVPQNLSREEFGRLASQIIDPNLFTERQAAAVAALGKTLPSISQLGTAATVAGAVVAYAVRLIATGQPLASGRYILAPETALTQPLA